LSDLAEAARAAIRREFKQMPDKIVLAFSVADSKSDSR
jgi:hypothetical protein